MRAQAKSLYGVLLRMTRGQSPYDQAAIDAALAQLEESVGKIAVVFTPNPKQDVVNAEYDTELPKPIGLADLGKHPRIVVNIEEHLKANPLKAGSFNHYRPARYFIENIATLGPKLDKPTLDRFEAAFKALNALL